MMHLFRDQSIPHPVKLAAALVILMAGFQFGYATVFYSISDFASLAFFKGVFDVALAVGLLRLSPLVRILMLTISLVSLLLLPVCFVVLLLSPSVFLEVAQLSHVQSLVIMAFIIGTHFLVFLGLFLLLRRSDVMTEFSRSGQPDSLI